MVAVGRKKKNNPKNTENPGPCLSSTVMNKASTKKKKKGAPRCRLHRRGSGARLVSEHLQGLQGVFRGIQGCRWVQTGFRFLSLGCKVVRTRALD